MDSVEALFFDVFGTCVDWRSSVTDYLIQSCHTTLSSSVASLSSLVRARASAMTPEDWAAFAQEWRDSYYVFTNASSQKDPPSSSTTTTTADDDSFIDIDTHHLDSLRSLLAKHSLTGLWDESQLQTVSQIWHRLQGWADSSRGLSQLSRRFAGRVSTLSNGTTALLRELTAFAALPFDRLLCAEDFRAYKPHPAVYRGAARALGLDPSRCALVAAHLADLRAASRLGMRTVYVERPAEESWAPDEVDRARAEGWVDVWVSLDEGADAENAGFVELARRLGCT